MDNFRPSRFDRLLDAADRMIRQVFSFVSGENTPPFDELHRAWQPILVRETARRRAPRRPNRPAHRPF